jgi:hypothetical protein
MITSGIETLNDLAPFVHEHLVPAIESAVEVCLHSYWSDEFNDKWTFGTQLWKNIWNRFSALASLDDCPFCTFGKGNEYKLKIGPFVLRHHRIDRSSNIPRAAKAVKYRAAAVQLMLEFESECEEERDNFVIAIDADVEYGLKEIFVGELLPVNGNSNNYRWVQKVPIYLASGAEPSTEEFIRFPEYQQSHQIASDEEIPKVTIKLDDSKTGIKIVESD